MKLNPTQVKDLEYICELAEMFLKDTGGIWAMRVKYYRQMLNKAIADDERLSKGDEGQRPQRS